MSLLEDELSTLIGKQIIVIMSDGRKFRGNLVNHDAKILVMDDVYELSEGLKWVRPIIYTSVSKNIIEKQDTIEHGKRGYLNTVLVNTRHIIRIWPYEPKRIEE
ncbi:hypothetical protein [[Eubacterium] cellulosolvens]